MSDDIERSLGRIEGKLDGIRSHLDQHHESIQLMDGRLGKVERRVTWFTGIGAAVMAAFGLFTRH